MAEGAFGDSGCRPSSEDVARALGRSSAAWRDLASWLSERFDPLSEEWRYSGEQWGWSKRVKRRKRTVLYLLPCRKHFRVTLVLGEKAVKKALLGELPDGLAAEIEGAKRYPEGRVLRLEVRARKDLEAVVALAESKMST